MKYEDAIKLKIGQCVSYAPSYKLPESGFITSIQNESKELRIFVCYDGTHRGQLTPWEYLVKR